MLAGPTEGDWVSGRHVPRVLGLEGAPASGIEASELRRSLASGSAVVVDLDFSRRYGQGHVPGAWFATRARLPDAVAKLPAAETIVLTSPDGRLARLAAAELAGIASVPVVSLTGGTEAWVAAGLPLEQGATHMADAADDVVLSARERGQDREAAMREYLEWEINLVNDMASDDDHRFQVARG
jgi:rhodanese-related sulfurtransferase